MTANTFLRVDATFAAVAAGDLPAITGPTRQVFTSGTGTYTKPAGCTWIEVEMVGGGGGGAGSGTGAAGMTAGGNTTFGSSFLTAQGGLVGVALAIGQSGGGATGGDINLSGGQSGGSVNIASAAGGHGGVSAFGGNAGSTASGNGGSPGLSNTGGGGGGGATATSNGWSATGGGAGGYCRKLIAAPNATYAYAVGAGGTGGTAGTGGFAGGAGGSGLIIVTEHYYG